VIKPLLDYIKLGYELDASPAELLNQLAAALQK
jgi:hypothetical protein